MKCNKITLGLILCLATLQITYGQSGKKFSAVSLKNNYLGKIEWLYPASARITSTGQVNLKVCVKAPKDFEIKEVILLKNGVEIPMSEHQDKAEKKKYPCAQNGGTIYAHTIEFFVDEIGKDVEFSVKAINNAGESISAARRILVSNTQFPPEVFPTFDEKKYYALMFAVNDYDEAFMNKLTQPLPDAMRLARVLEKQYGFEVTVVKNPTRSQALKELAAIKKKIKYYDNLLVFYSGHGVIKEDNTGYWPLSDATKDEASWLSNAEVLAKVNSIVCNDVLMIIDACYSGSIFTTQKGQKDIGRAVSIRKLNDNPSYQAMTSGFLRRVPDAGSFLPSLLNALRENNLPLITSLKLFSDLKEDAISKNMSNIPQFRRLKVKEGVNIGDFIFYQKKMRKK